MEEEIFEETTESSESTGLTYNDIYEAVYNGYKDAYYDIKRQEEEVEAVKKSMQINEETEELLDKVDEKIEEETEEETEEDIDEDSENISDENIEDKTFNVNLVGLDENLNLVDYSKIDNETVIASDDSLLEVSSPTDARFYTVNASPSTVEQQTVAYLMDIRNISIIFNFILIGLITFFAIKSSVIKFTKGRK